MSSIYRGFDVIQKEAKVYFWRDGNNKEHGPFCTDEEEAYSSIDKYKKEKQS